MNLKIFDSTSFYYNKPLIENDIIKDIKKYSKTFDSTFVNDYKKADLIITNTIYPDHIIEWSIKHNIPKIKRMDGIFWDKDNIYRNKELNDSAMLSDIVIFISEYSKNALGILYPDIKLKKEFVVLNNTDNRVFKNKNLRRRYEWFCSATDWDRIEKRFDSIVDFANYIVQDGEKILMIGRCGKNIPNNIIKTGYIDNYSSMNNFINSCNACVNLSYRDAGCKVVSQSLCCEKPVLYADSGGVPEIVGEYGISIKDNKGIDFEDLHKLNITDIISSYEKFKTIKFENIKNKKTYMETLSDYYNIFKTII